MNNIYIKTSREFKCIHGRLWKWITGPFPFLRPHNDLSIALSFAVDSVSLDSSRFTDLGQGCHRSLEGTSVLSPRNDSIEKSIFSLSITISTNRYIPRRFIHTCELPSLSIIFNNIIYFIILFNLIQGVCFRMTWHYVFLVT